MRITKRPQVEWHTVARVNVGSNPATRRATQALINRLRRERTDDKPLRRWPDKEDRKTILIQRRQLVT